MKVRFWGVRGSIPVPGPDTVRYGGNTTCIEIRDDDDTLIVLDAGTGIFGLARTLLGRMPIEAHIFITHAHWDHIHGLPFFTPLFIPGNHVDLYGVRDILTEADIDRVIDVQLQYSYFPINVLQLSDKFAFHTLGVESETVRIGRTTVTSVLMNHPVMNLGYRVECGGRSVFFTGDHEPRALMYDPNMPGNAWAPPGAAEEAEAPIDAVAKGVDLLIADSSYTCAEYPSHRDWGHGTYDSSIAFARRVGAKRLACTHHEPTRSDDELDRVFGEAVARTACPDEPQEILLAREGLEIEL